MSEETASRSQCPQCALSGGDTLKDNLITYKDGKFCHACSYRESVKKTTSLITGVVTAIDLRKLSLQTCEHYNVRTKHYTGRINQLELDEDIVLFPIYENGKVVKQKIKVLGVSGGAITARGATKSYKLFGQQAFNPTKRLPIVVTEGEYDAMSIYQCTGLPAVSITRGSKGAAKELLENLEWLSQWREVLICFDMDEPGRSAATECIALFEPSTAKNISLPLNDANEMLMNERGIDIKKCIQTAESIKPSTIVLPSDIINEILTPPKFGTPWPWAFMTKVTYGNRLGEVYMLAGDTSVGKTQVVYEIVTQHIRNGCKVGLIDLERQNAQTMQRIIGNIMNVKLHVPTRDQTFPTDEVKFHLDALKDHLFLYRPESGKLSIESVLINIRYLNKAYNVSFFVLDNLTALSVNMSHTMKEHEFASMCTGQLVHIAKELNVTIFIINHLTKASVQLNADITMGDDFVYNTNKEGLTWESGRMPEIAHIYGGGKVAKLPDFLIVCARNRVSTCEKERCTLKVKFLKTRFDSEFEGQSFNLFYDSKIGRLVEQYSQN